MEYEEEMPEIKGDYGGILKTVRCNADAKLETVSAIEAGSAIIGNIDRVATVGQIDHLGSIANTEFNIGRVGTIGDIEHLGSIGNTVFDQGSITDHKREMYIEQYGTWEALQGTVHGAYTIPKADRLGTFYNLRANRDRDLVTAPGWTGSRRVKLLTDDDWRLKLATLGTVERVKDIDNVGTVGRLETIGMIEAGTISEVTHVGTIGDITHLGSIGNTSFDQGSVSDHKREMYGWDETDWEKVRTDTGGKLKTAPATTRKGGKQTVNNIGTAVALIGTHTVCTSVIVKALHANAGEIYVGDSTVGSATGYILQKDEWVSFSADDVNDVYIDRNAGTQGVSFLYTNY